MSLRRKTRRHPLRHPRKGESGYRSYARWKRKRARRHAKYARGLKVLRRAAKKPGKRGKHFARILRPSKRRRSKTRIVNKVTSKGRGITVKMSKGRVVAYRVFNTKTRRFRWKKVAKNTARSRANVLARLHAFAGRK